jgi:hypothetical protein
VEAIFLFNWESILFHQPVITVTDRLLVFYARHCLHTQIDKQSQAGDTDNLTDDEMHQLSCIHLTDIFLQHIINVYMYCLTKNQS